MPRYTKKFQTYLDLRDQQTAEIKEIYDELLARPSSNYDKKLEAVEKKITAMEPPARYFSLGAFFRHYWNKMFGDKQGDPEYNDYLKSRELRENWDEEKQGLKNELLVRTQEIEQVLEQRRNRDSREDERLLQVGDSARKEEFKGFFGNLDEAQKQYRDSLKVLLAENAQMTERFSSGVPFKDDEGVMLKLDLETNKDQMKGVVAKIIGSGLLSEAARGKSNLPQEKCDQLRTMTAEQIEGESEKFSRQLLGYDESADPRLAEQFDAFMEDEENRGLLESFANGNSSEIQLTNAFLKRIAASAEPENVDVEQQEEPVSKPEDGMLPS